MRYGVYEHRLQICRGEYPGEMSNRTALHESKIIILEFDEEHIVSYSISLFSSQIVNSERQVRIKRIGNTAVNLRHPFSTSVSSITIGPNSITYIHLDHSFSHKTRKNVEFTSYDQLLKIEGRIWEYSKEIDKYELIKVRIIFIPYSAIKNVWRYSVILVIVKVQCSHLSVVKRGKEGRGKKGR